MASQALIKINGTVGSDDDLPINTLVQLDNQGLGGETTYLWEILDQPPGAVDALSNPAVQAPTFTPKKEGTYLVRLTVDDGLPTEATDTVIAAVRQLKTRERIPAAGETLEGDASDGWAAAANSLFRKVDSLAADSSIVIGVNTTIDILTKGTVVRVTSGAVIKSGLPGQEIVPGFTKAPATSLGNVDELLCVIVGAVDGGASIGVNELAVARYAGRLSAIPLGGAVGDTVYVSDTATIATTAGTVKRRIGSVMSVDGSDRDVWIDGVGGQDITPIDRAYVLYGSPGTLTNTNRIDGNNATGASGGVPYTFRQADASTIGVKIKRFNSSSQDLLQVVTEGGAILAQIFNDGSLYMSNDGAIRPVIEAVALAGNAVALQGYGSGTGSGVEGIGTGGAGVSGYATFGDTEGLHGEGHGAGAGGLGLGGSTGGPGYHGKGTTGHGLVAESDTTSPAKSALRVVPQDAAGSSPDGKGDLRIDTADGRWRLYNGTGEEIGITEAVVSVSDSNTISNTDSEVDFNKQYTVKAGTLRLGTTIRIHGLIDIMKTGGPPTFTLRVYFGANIYCYLVLTATTGKIDFDAFFCIMAMGAGSAFILGDARALIGDGSGGTATAYLGAHGTNNNNTSIDNIVKVSGQFSVADPSNYAVLKHIFIDMA